MDLQDDFADMFAADDPLVDDISINGVVINGYFVEPDVIEEPYYGRDEAVDSRFVLVQRGDLATLGQWPPADPIVVVNLVTYRVIRALDNAGHVRLFLQEAA